MLVFVKIHIHIHMVCSNRCKYVHIDCLRPFQKWNLSFTNWAKEKMVECSSLKQVMRTTKCAQSSHSSGICETYRILAFLKSRNEVSLGFLGAILDPITEGVLLEQMLPAFFYGPTIESSLMLSMTWFCEEWCCLIVFGDSMSFGQNPQIPKRPQNHPLVPLKPLQFTTSWVQIAGFLVWPYLYLHSINFVILYCVLYHWLVLKFYRLVNMPYIYTSSLNPWNSITIGWVQKRKRFRTCRSSVSLASLRAHAALHQSFRSSHKSMKARVHSGFNGNYGWLWKNLFEMTIVHDVHDLDEIWDFHDFDETSSSRFLGWVFLFFPERVESHPTRRHQIRGRCFRGESFRIIRAGCLQ